MALAKHQEMLPDGGFSLCIRPFHLQLFSLLVYIILKDYVGAHLGVHRVQDTHSHCISIYRNHRTSALPKKPSSIIHVFHVPQLTIYQFPQADNKSHFIAKHTSPPSTSTVLTLPGSNPPKSTNLLMLIFSPATSPLSGGNTTATPFHSNEWCTHLSPLTEVFRSGDRVAKICVYVDSGWGH